MNFRLLIASTLVGLTIFGCASRYRLAFYMDADNARRRLKVEQTQYLLNARLGDPFNDQKVISGNGKCLVIMASARGEQINLPATGMLGYDEYLKVRLFVELIDPVKAGAFDLKARSFVQTLGRYNLLPKDKIFLPDSGRIVIDSIAKEHLFASLNGKFVNSSGTPIRFDGQFRARIRR